MKKIIVLLIIAAAVIGVAAWGFHATISGSMSRAYTTPCTMRAAGMVKVP